jgi:hypothetical protein
VVRHGSSVTAPHWALWFPNGQWDAENIGVAPGWSGLLRWGRAPRNGMREHQGGRCDGGWKMLDRGARSRAEGNIRSDKSKMQQH